MGVVDYFVESPDETALWGPACEAAANGEISDLFIDKFFVLAPPQKRNTGFCNSYDQPTSSTEGDCYGVPADQYLGLMDGIVPAMVSGMDYAGSKCTFKIDFKKYNIHVVSFVI
jgi:hypothetical protein